MKSYLPAVLKEQRAESGKCQTEVAQDLGISQKVYSTYECGTREPNIEMLIKMAEYFGIPIDILVGRYVIKKWYLIVVKLTEEQFGFLYNYIFDRASDCWKKYYSSNGEDVTAYNLRTKLGDIQKVLVHSEKVYKSKNW